MRSVEPMRTAKIGYIIISTALCVLGVLLIAVPGFSVSMLGIMCGITLIVFGCVKLTGYFSRDLYRLAFQYDLTSGIVLIALGVVMLVRPGSLMTFICITLGLFILTDGLFKLQIAMRFKAVRHQGMVADSGTCRDNRDLRASAHAPSRRGRQGHHGHARHHAYLRRVCSISAPC